MYHPLLTTRYLTSRVIPLIAVAAVALCVALVIVVISVMTGFLNMVRDSGKTLIGDVVISYPIAGIPYYDRIIDRLTKNPSVASAAPVVDAFGLLQMPYPDGPNKQTETVQFWGIDSRFAQVTSFADTLHWKVPTDHQFLLLFADALRNNYKSLLATLTDSQKSSILKALDLDLNPSRTIQSMDANEWNTIFSYLSMEPAIVHNTLTSDQWNTLLLADPRLATHSAFVDVIAKNPSTLLNFLSDSNRATLYKNWLEHQQPPISDAKRDAALKSPPTSDQWSAILTDLAFNMNLIRSYLSDAQWQKLLAFDPRLSQPNALITQGLSLTHNGKPAADLGMHVSEGNMRNHEGEYDVAQSDHWWMPLWNVTLTTLPVHAGALSSEPESFIFPVANEFISGVYLIDNKRIMIPLDVAQHMLHLDKSTRVDPDDPTVELGEDPARVTMILVRARPGVSADDLREIVADEYQKLDAEMSRERSSSPTYMAALPPYFGFRNGGGGGGIAIQTWAQQQASFIDPVEKERELMRTLFSIVYVVCAALVLSIFWAIVYEKTRDIGILRSIGASRSGIVWIFLRYGLVVGIIGSLVGALLATLVIHNINAIHSALGNPPIYLAFIFGALAVFSCGFSIYRALSGNFLPLVLGSVVVLLFAILTSGVIALRAVGGVVIWDPAVYYFSQIPNQLDVTTTITTMIGAIIFSLLGAVIPAAKAADTDPVHALRYE